MRHARYSSANLRRKQTQRDTDTVTIRDDTIKELLEKITTKVMGRTTHASIEKTRNELAKIGASIKTTNTDLTEGTEFGYAVAIMTAREYQNIVTPMDSAWTFTNTTNPETYCLSIKTLTV